MLGQGGFNLRKYQTNGVNREGTNGESRGSIESSGDEDESYARATLGTSHSGDQQEQKVLGVRWNADAGIQWYRRESFFNGADQAKHY